jgi:uncharacterized protein YbjT (DUF2867 family)
MSDPLRVVLVGATGLVGQAVIAESLGREDLRLTAVARRETPLPRGARMEVFVAEPSHWGEVIEAVRPKAVICALGTTWNKAGRDEAAFRAVDQELVLATARAAKAHGVERFVAVSSTGADAASRTFYLRVKGEVERELAAIRFPRLDILRPGLLRGARGGERRPAERLAMVLSLLADRLLHGKYRALRSIRAESVAQAALALASRKAAGRFVHDNDAIMRAARSLPQPVG